MKFIEKFKSVLPSNVVFEDLYDLAPADLWQRDPRRACVIALKRSDIFDTEKYLNEYRDVRDSRMNGILHFITYGIVDNRFFFLKKENNLLINTEIDDKKSKNIKVSIIMPNLNNAKYLNECLNSIVKQTLKEIEIICVDSGSTDGSLEIIKEFCKDDNRIRLIEVKYKSYGYQMNVGIRSAKGEYIGIVETDDYVMNDMYEIMYNKAKEKNYDAVKCNFSRFIDYKGKRLIQNVDVLSKNLYNKSLNVKNEISLMKSYILNQNGIYKRNLIKKFNIKFNETPGAAYQDNGFYFQIMMFYQSIFFISNYLYMLRRDNESSSVLSNKNMYAIVKEYNYISKFLKLKKLSRDIITIYYLRKLHNYDFTLQRIENRYKKSFIKIFSADFKNALNKKLIDKLIFGEYNYKKAVEVAFKPKLYLDKNINKKIDFLSEEKKKYDVEINDSFISIIIPCYNVENYIRRCLDSVINQTCKNFEVLCIDDGSTDDTHKILQEYQDRDQRFKIFQQTNSGVSNARNSCIEKAIGKYILFIDADDYIELNTLEVLENVLKEYKYDLIVFSGKTIPECLDDNKKLKSSNKVYSFNPFEALFYENSIKPFLPNKLYKREILDRFNIRFDTDLNICEDNLLIFKYVSHCDHIKFIDYTLYNYCKRTDSACGYFNNNLVEKYNFHLLMIKKLYLYYNLNGYLQGNEYKLIEWSLNFLDPVLKNLETRNLFIKEIERVFSDYNLLNQYKNFTDYNQKFIFLRYPKISIIMPVFNAEEFLEETITSILNQSFFDFELICIDDGSIDKSYEILKNFQRKDERVKVYHINHSYAGVARNHGIEHSKGEYLIFLDSDDLLEENMLQSMYSEIIKTNSDICISSGVMFNTCTKSIIKMPWICKKYQVSNEISLEDQHNPNIKYIYSCTTPAPWNKLIKRDIVIKNNLKFQNSRSANDLYFIFMAISLSKKIVLLDKELIKYRIGNKKSLQLTQDKDIYCWYRACLKLMKGLNYFNIFDKFRDQFINFSLDYAIYNLSTINNISQKIELYNFIKKYAFEKLLINTKTKEFFYGYSPNNGVKYSKIQELNFEEYNSSFNELKTVNLR